MAFISRGLGDYYKSSEIYLTIAEEWRYLFDKYHPPKDNLTCERFFYLRRQGVSLEEIEQRLLFVIDVSLTAGSVNYATQMGVEASTCRVDTNLEAPKKDISSIVAYYYNRK